MSQKEKLPMVRQVRRRRDLSWKQKGVENLEQWSSKIEHKCFKEQEKEKKLQFQLHISYS